MSEFMVVVPVMAAAIAGGGFALWRGWLAHAKHSAVARAPAPAGPVPPRPTIQVAPPVPVLDDALADRLPLGVLVVDKDGLIRLHNQAFRDLTRMPRERFGPGTPLLALLRFCAERGDYGGGDLEELVAKRLAVYAQRAPWQVEREMEDGRVVEIAFEPLEDGGFIATGLDVTARRAAEVKSSEGEAQFRDFAEATADWFWERDEDLAYTYVSPTIIESCGLTPAEFIGHPDPDARPEHVAPARWMRHLEDLRERRAFRDLRIARRDRHGRLRYFSLSGRPVFDAGGEFRGFRGSGRDVTTEMEAEARVRAAQRRLNAAVEGLPDALAFYDTNDRLVMCNEAYRNILRPVDHLLVPGASFEELLRGAVAAGRFREAVDDPEGYIRRRLHRHRNPHGVLVVQLDDSRWFQVREHPLSDGGTAVIATDISEHKQNEREVAQKKDLLQATLDHMGEGIAVVGPDGALVTWNARFMELLGLPASVMVAGVSHDDIIGWQIDSGEFGAVDREAEYARRRAAMQNADIVYERTRPNGRALEVRRNRMPGGGFVTLYADVTERKAALDAMRMGKEAAELANRTKTDFLANMSHELRTPLNAIIGFSEIIHQQLFGKLGSDRYVEYAKDIYNSGTHLLTLINDILDVSKAEAGKIELHDDVIRLDDVIDASLRIVRPRAEDAQVTLRAPATASLPPLRADERRLKQVMLNLLSNAVKFTPAGGKVDIQVGLNERGAVFVRVSDTGIGIAENDISKVLAPFGQVDSTLARKHEGTGLGLPLSKALVELHGGQLDIASTVGQGTSVTVTIPSERVMQPVDERQAAAG